MNWPESSWLGEHPPVILSVSEGSHAMGNEIFVTLRMTVER